MNSGEIKIRTESAIPNAARFMRDVLRGSTYTFSTALADVIDNSIEAGASKIDVFVEYDQLRVTILDNGSGMSDRMHSESMKIAAETRQYSDADLGKYGTGMKAASLSQAQRLTVATRNSDSRVVTVRCLDLDHITETNDWEQLTIVLDQSELVELVQEQLRAHTGTAVIWEKLDRVFAQDGLSRGAAVDELKSQTRLAEEHLAMVFHRFLSGESSSKIAVAISINGNSIKPWDPFARAEKTILVSQQVIPINQSSVTISGFVLPTEKEFSSKLAFQRAAGPKKWNESQGFYVYRNDRLIRWGGWLRLRASDEHSKLARVALDFTSDLDPIFQVDVAKSSIVLPQSVKELFKPIVSTITAQAIKRYRNKTTPQSTSGLPGRDRVPTPVPARRLSAEAFAKLLEKISSEANLVSELRKIKNAVIANSPNLASDIGWEAERCSNDHN